MKNTLRSKYLFRRGIHASSLYSGVYGKLIFSVKRKRKLYLEQETTLFFTYLL